MDEEIKKGWNETRFSPSDREYVNEVINGKRRTALQKLACRYRRFSNVGLLMIAWSSLLMFNNILPEGTKVYFSIAFATYFLMCSIMDRWLYQGVSRIDCVSMAVGEVSRLATFYRKRHLQFMIILIPIAIALLGSFIYVMVDNIYFIYGVICGAVIGLAIGIFQFMEFMADYRDVMNK